MNLLPRHGALILIGALSMLGAAGCDPVAEDDDDVMGDDDDTSDDDAADDDAADDDTAVDPCEGVQLEITEIEPDDLAAMLEGDEELWLINVHIPYEGEIPGTDAHIPFNDLDALKQFLGDDLGTEAVLYCKSGPMSASAAQDLLGEGYCRIHDLPAGMNGWLEAGYTLDD